jgi:hypothetical protein
MNATPPEANSEYSRGSEPSRGSSPFRFSTRSQHEAAASEGSAERPQGGAPASGSGGDGAAAAGGVRLAILATGLLGALLLLVAEFTTLFEVRTKASGAPLHTVTTGSHHSYALVPVALLAAALAYGVWRVGSRPALLALGLLGVLALLIALVGDLPDAHATGLLRGPGGTYVTASSTPSAGMYMETLGAVLLLIACVCGFVLLGPPPRPPRRARVSAG